MDIIKRRLRTGFPIFGTRMHMVWMDRWLCVLKDGILMTFNATLFLSAPTTPLP
jgi:hypothetical protein